MLLKNVRMKNYRLTELSSEAYGLCKQINDEGRNVVLTDEWMKRYGELIVRECARICRDRKLTPSVFTADELLEHFGVE